MKCAERNNREIRRNLDPVQEIFRDERESDPKRIQKHEQNRTRNHTSAEVVPTSAAHDLLDSTLGGGQLEWRFCDPLRTVVADSNQSKTEYKRETRQRMGRLTDTKVRGFMVTETNNDACAQLQPVLAHAASLTLQPSPPERVAPSCWAVGLFLSIAIKLNSGRMNLRSASKSTLRHCAIATATARCSISIGSGHAPGIAMAPRHSST